MSDTPELPPIPELTVNQAHKAICADYLRSIAKMIEQDKITAFEFMWNLEIQKPVGRVSLNAEVLVGPMETRVLAAIAQHRREQEAKIPVQDISKELQDRDIDPHNENDN